MKNNSEDLKSSTLLLFALTIASAFCAILCYENLKMIQGHTITSIGLLFLCQTFLSRKYSYYALVSGLIVFLIFSGTLSFFFPRIIREGVAFSSPYVYLLMILLTFIYLIRTNNKNRLNNSQNS